MIAFIFKSNLRLIARNKITSFVKIIGLASGTAIVLLTTQFCLHELRYDQQHPNADRIFRYVHRANSPDGMESFAFTSAMTAPALKERYPEVESFVRVLVTRAGIRNPQSDAAFNENRFAFVEENFFTIFNFPLKKDAEATSLLKDPLSVVLTPSSARKYFGDIDPVGKSLLLNGELEFIVRGVLKDDLTQSHFKFDFIAPFSALTNIANHPAIAQQIPASLNLEKKGYNSFYTYLVLTSPSAAEDLIAKFPSFIEDFRGKGRSERLKPTLQSLTSIHLSSNLLYEIDQNGSLKMIYVFIFIGILTLLIACINYINTTTAEFLKRAQGIGLKKILGIKRSTLLWGHLAETCMLSSISLIIGYILALVLLPFFNDIVNRNISLFSIESVFLLLGVFLFIVIISGIYPAIKITQTEALQAFKGNTNTKPSKLSLRNALVSFQLVISFCLISISLLVFHQLDYINSQDMGFDAEQVIVLNATAVDAKKRISFKNNLMNEQHITQAGMCSTPPGETLFTYGLSFPEHGVDEDARIIFYQSFVDSDYLQALGIKVNTGRFFSPENASDSDAYVIINNAAVQMLGESALKSNFKYKDAFKGKDVNKTVLGVIDNFNFASLHQEIKPLMLDYDPELCGYILVRFNVREAQSVLQNLEKQWKANFPTSAFDYYFLDEKFRELYESDQRQKRLVTLIAGVAICLAALGIFGTTMFMAEQKTKEIGVRKILGSERSQLLMLLVKPTLVLIVISSAIGVPIALTFGNNWLMQYPYRVTFSPVLFVLALVLIIIIVMATISYQCYKLTTINPTEVLRKTL